MRLSPEEKKQFLQSLWPPLVFVVLIWAIHLLEVLTNYPLYFLGINPREPSGLIGIFTSVFIHGSWMHLFSNTFPVLVLGAALFFFYKELAYSVIIWSLLMGGLWVWVAARPSFHIGVSGLIYSLSFYLIISGILIKNTNLMAISLLVLFLYSGGMIAGMLPIDEGVSWEGHLYGAIAGTILAFYYRKKGPKKKRYNWEDEEEDLIFDEEFGWIPRPEESNNGNIDHEIKLNYNLKKNEK